MLRLAATALAATVLATGPSFSGYGGRELAAFRVAQASTLRWTNGGPIFQVFPRNVTSTGPVNSTARSGATYLAPGRHLLNVGAIGNWTIRVVPGVERPRALGNGLVGFRGNGARELPPFATVRAKTLVWTNTGALFQVSTDDLTVSVGSSGKRGRAPLPAGTHQLTVNAVGSWTLGWLPS